MRVRGLWLQLLLIHLTKKISLGPGSNAPVKGEEGGKLLRLIAAGGREGPGCQSLGVFYRKRNLSF